MTNNNNLSWNLRERFQKYPGYQGMYATIFANRQVEDFNIDVGIVDPVNIAYAFRYDEYWDYCREEEPTLNLQLDTLLKDPQINRLEAIIFGKYIDVFDREQSEYLVWFLVNNKNKFNNLKAIFIGDIHYEELEISWIHQGNITPVLEAYPNLELLQIRAGEDLEDFTPIKHDNLRSLIIESSGIDKENIASICALKLPALEHLELWLGTDSYGGNSSVEDLSPILSGDLYPNLVYLGLRNSEYTDEIATALVDAPIMNSIEVLDLSMGTLTDEGAKKLLDLPSIERLKILNISENYLSDAIISQFKQLNIEVLSDDQKPEEEDGDRYCSVTE